jgi:tocopherol O-methyltransferase
MSDKAFNTNDVADYYDQTLIHYKQWWNLKESQSLHYGMWFEDTKSFTESLHNTNKIMAIHASIADNSHVLDAGCGVGGAALFLAKEFNCDVQGITLSPKQVDFARSAIDKQSLGHLVEISKQDYTKTSFSDNSFDFVWACESSSSAPDKLDFIKEAYRVLKPGGKLILTDFFWPEDGMDDVSQYMEKWGKTWGISAFETIKAFNKHLIASGFKNLELHDYTSNVTPSAKRMYRAYQFGTPWSLAYNAINKRKVSRFARTHYLCGKYQYKALLAGLWKYKLIVASKPC